jgi:hypothetical protein
MRANFLIVIITLIISIFTAPVDAQTQKRKTTGTFTTYGKVIKIDKNNIFHLGLEGDYVFGHLSFIRMPIEGEGYFEQAHEFLKQYEGEWLRVTEVRRLSTPKSKSYLVYTARGKSVNMEMIRQGLAIPFLPDQPPGHLIDAALTAKDKKLNMWQDENLRLNTAGEHVAKDYLMYIAKLKDEIGDKLREHYFRVGDKAYHQSCMTNFKQHDGFIFSEGSARHKGLTIMPKCTPPKTNQPQTQEP